MIIKIKSILSLSMLLSLSALIIITITILNKFIAPKLIKIESELVQNEISKISSYILRELGQVKAQQRAITQLIPAMQSDEIDKSLPHLLDQYGEKKIFGGGIWPLPNKRKDGKTKFSTFFHRNNQGEMTENTYWNSAEAPNYFEQVWYNNGRNAPHGECAWAKAYRDDASIEARTNCAMGIYSNIGLYGVATIDVTLGFFNTLAANSEKKLNAQVMILEHDGTIVSNSSAINESILLRNIQEFKHSSSFASQLGKTQLSAVTSSINEYIGINGEELTLLVMEVADTPWLVAVNIPSSALRQQTSALMSTLLSIQIPLLLLLFFVVAMGAWKLLGRLARLKQSIDELSAGEADLTRRLNIGRGDEIDDISISVNRFIEFLQSMIANISASSNSITQSLNQLYSGSEHSKQTLLSHAEETDQIVTAITEMSATSDEMANNSNSTAEFIHKVKEQASNSKGLVRKASDSVDELFQTVELATKEVMQMSQHVQDITPILDGISSIAEQTNLLALNAAIEAARAGDQGRGFAVVADEVRALAARTQASTKEINTKLSQLNGGVTLVVSSIEKTRSCTDMTAKHTSSVNKGLDDVAEAINQIHELSFQIATAAEEQSAVSKQIDSSMVNIREIVNSLVEQDGTNSFSMQSLTDANTQLVHIIKGFKVK